MKRRRPDKMSRRSTGERKIVPRRSNDAEQSFSKTNGPTPAKVPTRTPRKKPQNLNDSIFADDYQPDEPVLDWNSQDPGVTYVSGRGVGGRNFELNREAMKKQEHDLEIQRAMRQVSGIGYGNHLIENEVRLNRIKLSQSLGDAVVEISDDEDGSFSLPDIQLKPVGKLKKRYHRKSKKSSNNVTM